MPKLGSTLALCLTAVLLGAPFGARGGEASSPENSACLSCHGTPGFAAQRADGTERPLFVAADAFAGSVHGSLACTGCHADMATIPHERASRTRLEWRRKSVEACSGCHVDAAKDYGASAHGHALLRAGNASSASCSDCHTAHAMTRTQGNRLALNAACTRCHAGESASYGMTYHGQLAALGSANTATCFDCHGAHALAKPGEPSSRASIENRLATCRSCHTEATAGYVSFQPHATTHDFERYPVMWVASKLLFAMIVGALGLFWVHSALWFYREYRDRRARKPRPHVAAQALPEAQVRRWSGAWRLAHLGFALSVIALVATGIPPLYPNTTWARALESGMGGPAMVSLSHKTAAVIMVAIFAAHLIYVAVHLTRTWKSFKVFGAYSLMPNWQDAYDFIAMFKWFVGRGPKPVSDHWNYMQKVDYWAPFWGIAMLTATGAMLWFKNLSAQYLPGWSLNVATLVHGEEALLAAVYLFTIHYFTTHWRPDKFPLDVVMFTGSMPLEEFRREYSVEYDRLVASGQMERHLVQAPSRPMTVGSQLLGFAMVAIGLVLLVLIGHGVFSTL